PLVSLYHVMAARVWMGLQGQHSLDIADALVRQGGVWELVMGGGRARTAVLVNGARTARAPLRHGDRLELTKLKGMVAVFHDPLPAAPRPPPAAAFEQAIRDDPDDASLRLIYADWLDDHGEAERAEFIRLQCDLADGPEPLAGDPRSARADDLWRRRGWDWIGGVVPALADRWEVRRGFVERIDLDPITLAVNAEKLLRAAPLRLVRPRVADAADVTALLDVP